jgi:hypothetical protein
MRSSLQLKLCPISFEHESKNLNFMQHMKKGSAGSPLRLVAGHLFESWNTFGVWIFGIAQ